MPTVALTVCNSAPGDVVTSTTLLNWPTSSVALTVRISDTLHGLLVHLARREPGLGERDVVLGDDIRDDVTPRPVGCGCESEVQGVIHEKVAPDIDRLAETRGMSIADVNLCLEHVGYDGPQEHKHRRNLPMLQAELALRPDDAYNWHHLGRVLDGLGDRAGALSAWRRALAVARKEKVRQPWKAAIYVELVQAVEIDPAEARELLDEAKESFPGNPLLRFWDATLRSRAGDMAAALAIFHALTEIDAETFIDGRSAFDKRLFGEHSFAALGACYFKLGRYDESAAWYARAAAANPTSTEYRIKQKLAAAKAG